MSAPGLALLCQVQQSKGKIGVGARQIEHVDVVLNRGSSSEALQKLYPALDAEGEFEGMADARFSRRIRASNVAAMAATLVPRQQGG